MKTKIAIAILVAVLFGAATAVVYSTAGSGTENVRICPNSGLPCDGDGLCGSGNGQPCGGGCCDTHHDPSSKNGHSHAEKTCANDCADCPDKASEAKR